MYSPYPATLVFAILQTIFFITACIMQSCELKNTTKVVYYVVMTSMVVMDILMLFSISMGVGASGYDAGTKNCYLKQWLFSETYQKYDVIVEEKIYWSV